MKSIYDFLGNNLPGFSPATTDASQAKVPPKVGRGNAGTGVAGYAAGGPIQPVGGQIPPAPSDTVPIAATPGEFMIPQPVVQFLGEKFFRDLIARAQSEMGAAGETNPFVEMSEEDDVMPQGFQQR